MDYKYVDETDEIAQLYILDYEPTISFSTISEKPRSEASVEKHTLHERSILNEPVRSQSSGHFMTPHLHDRNLENRSPFAVELSPRIQSSISSASPHLSYSSNASPGSRDYSYPTGIELPNLNEREACLMRYFVVQLAPWVCIKYFVTYFLFVGANSHISTQFDICDGDRNFACTVPLRARTCPPLLNAIYTASARHLSRIKRYWHGNQVHYGGKVLPDLKPETAIHYHNECIAHLVSISDHSREAQDENLLAAAVILRFYEEVDCKSHLTQWSCLTQGINVIRPVESMGEDTENGLKGIHIFLDARVLDGEVLDYTP